jgi:hypothetical protein
MASIFNLIRTSSHVTNTSKLASQFIRGMKTVAFPLRYYSINDIQKRSELLSKGFHNTIFDKIKNGFIYNSFVSINIDNDILKTQITRYKEEINSLREFHSEINYEDKELEKTILELEIEYRKYNVLINTINIYHTNTLKMIRCNDFQQNLVDICNDKIEFYEIECINYIDTMYKTQYIQELLFDLFPELCCFSKYDKNTDKRVLYITKVDNIFGQHLSLNSLSHDY